MNIETVTATADNGARVEIATLHYESMSFTNYGSVLDIDNGHVYAYATDTRNPARPGRKLLTTFGGAPIGEYYTVSTWKRYNAWEPYTMHAIRARINGDDREWIGRYNYDGSSLVHLTPAKGG